MLKENELEQIALECRKRILRCAWRANGGHIAPSYSCIEILTTLYFSDILKFDAKNPNWTERDYFILSKGHAVLALYSVLAKAGYYEENLLDDFCQKGSEFGSLAKKGTVPGIEASTGSLGHGLSYAVGIALALKKDRKENHVYVLLGDGECEEGSVWEALMSAVHNKLDNMTIIVDYNHLQAMGDIEEILTFDRIADRMNAFGLNTVEIDGHDFREIHKALLIRKENPTVVIANTVKGKGISFMENVPIWHYRIPNDEEIGTALDELQMTREELGEHEKCLFRNII